MELQRDAEDRVRVGLVGVGTHAYRNILPALTFLPVELVAVADLDAELAGRTAAQYGVRAYSSAVAMSSAESLDAVLLCASPDAHPQLAIEAFRAGLHVWMEKPAATSVAEVDRMLKEVGDLVAMVGYKKAFMPATRKVLELVTDDAVNSIHATYPLVVPSAVDPEDDRRRRAAIWLDHGCHPLSFLVRVAGPVRCLTVHRGQAGSGVIVLEHVRGALSTLQLALGAPHSYPFERYTVFGSTTAIDVENSRRVTYRRGVPLTPYTDTFAPVGLESGAVVWEAQDSWSTFATRAEVTQGIHGELAHFVACIRSGTRPESADLQFARHLAQLHEAAIVSDGDTVHLGEDR